MQFLPILLKWLSNFALANFATGELEWKNIFEYHQAAGHGEFAKNRSCT